MRKNRATYYGKKLLIFLISIFVLSIAVFYISRIAPGDPLVSYYGERAEKMTPQEKDLAREKLGLNDAIYVQYIKWLKEAFKGNFGISFKYKQDVLSVISGRITNTLILGGIGFILLFALALLLGIFCAWHEDRLPDRIVCQIGTATSCIPEFWLALVLILVFAMMLRILPSSGAYTIGGGGIADRIEHLILPVTVLIINHLWYYAYMIRNRLLEEVRENYVLLAKTKGLSKGKILFTHCLRNILPSFLSLMAISVPHIMGGTYVIETVFSYPGIGTLAYESARYHDYTLLMVLCIFTGIVVIFFNILAQIINERIDPRMKAEEALESGGDTVSG